MHKSPTVLAVATELHPLKFELQNPNPNPDTYIYVCMYVYKEVF